MSSKEIEIPLKKEEEDDILLEANDENILNSNTNKESIKKPFSKDFQEKNNIKQSYFKIILKLPLIFNFFFLILFGIIIFIFVYIIFYFVKKANFKIVDINWDNADLNDRKYENYFFDNDLEVMLIQDKLFDRDGGGIVIEKGYMDDPLNEGISTIATYLLEFIAFEDEKPNIILEDYYGKKSIEIEEDFINFSFDILNNGFKKFLYFFSLILNPNELSKYYDKYFEIITYKMDYQYENKIYNIFQKEKHLLEYLVYGLKNDNNNDILPEGSSLSIKKYKKDKLKTEVLNYINKIINPGNIKMAFFSKYKFLISSKYMKKYFNYLTKMKKKNNTENKKEFITQTSQIFFLKVEYFNYNFIDIIYVIEKVGKESYSELYYKSQYLNYIIDFLNEKKEGSLYNLLTNDSKFNIKEIISSYSIVLKRKIEFFIYIVLNCLENINDIIFITYQYMEKIIKETKNKIDMDRYMELKNKFYQDMKYSDKTFNTIELAKNNALFLFLSEFDKKKYFFYQGFMPWEENDTEEIIRKNAIEYFGQLKPEKSVIVLGIKDTDSNKFTCNNNSLFPLNCSYFKENKYTNTNYYEVYYINDTFDSSLFENELENNTNININFTKNNYTSKHNESFLNIEEEETPIIPIKNKSIFNKFFFKRNTKFKLPKVYISLNLFHPYLRPMRYNKNESNCMYFKIIEIFSAIKRKAYENLADAIRAGNELEFGQNENYLFINVFCYEDVAYNIMKEIKTIIYDIDWELTDFISNNKIYKNEAFDDFFSFYNDYEDISKYYFYSKLKNHIFNLYEFFPKEFEDNDYENCTKNKFNSTVFKKLKSFSINGYIYGYYTEKEAENISNLFEPKFDEKDFKELLIDCNNTEIENYNIENFIKWVNEIKELTENDKIPIHPKIYNLSSKDSFNFRITYLKFNESELEVSLFENILERVNLEGKLREISMFKYRDIFLELLFYDDDDYISIKDLLKDEILENAWNSTLFNMYKYNNKVDNIGNRYYYIKKNFNLTLFKQQTSLKQRANDELQSYLYNGTVINPVNIMNMYNKKYKNKKFDKKELNRTINKFLYVSNRKRIDIYPSEEEMI